MQARRALLEGILDYAGLFPPQALPLDEAVRTYGELRHHPHAWMLGRFVIPAGRLADLDPPEAWPLAVLLGRGADWLAALREETSALAAFRARQPDCPVEVAELAVPAGAPLEAGLDLLPPDLLVFCEPGWGAELEAGIARLGALRGAGRPVALKLRTGGLKAEDHPEPEQLARAMVAAAGAGVPMKFTAGLHQPVRHEAPGPGCRQFGFVGVFMAAMLARDPGVPLEDLVALLEEPRMGAFQARGELAWRHHRLAAERVWELRQHVVGFGSCSFQEPLEALVDAGWLSRTGGMEP